MNRLKIILREDHTLHEMMIGIVLINILPAIASIFVKDTRKALLGVAIGTVTALVYCIHLAVTVDDALCLDEKGAAASMRKQMAVRYAFVCIVSALCFLFDIVHPIFFVISLITIKAGAYMQPFVHKITKWRNDD